MHPDGDLETRTPREELSDEDPGEGEPEGRPEEEPHQEGEPEAEDRPPTQLPLVSHHQFVVLTLVDEFTRWCFNYPLLIT